MKKDGDRSRRPQLHGGDKGVRTPDLVTASHALSQLSYIHALVRKQLYQTVRQGQQVFWKTSTTAGGRPEHRT